jgi:hypothetical protein
MKIPIQPNSVTFEDIKTKLSSRFPDYKLNIRSKSIIIVQKSATAGANVVIRKNKILVAANFPTVGGTMLFMLSIILLGVLIPIILYFAIFFAAQKKVEKEVGEYIKTEYGQPS